MGFEVSQFVPRPADDGVLVEYAAPPPAEADTIIEDPENTDATSGAKVPTEGGRNKAVERQREVQYGWAVFCCCTHKEDYTAVINSNPKNRAITLLQYLSDPDSCKPPKNYRGELAVKVAIAPGTETILAVIWHVPGTASDPSAEEIVPGKCIVDTFKVESTWKRDDASKTVRWRHPRHIAEKHVVVTHPDEEALEEMALQVFQDLLSDIEYEELDGDDALGCLCDQVVHDAGCFFYGPDTMCAEVCLGEDGECVSTEWRFRTPIQDQWAA